MSDDSFIREVNEELRQDQARALWNRYGIIAIGAAVLVILLTGAYVAWDYWETGKANRSGDEFSRALTLASQGSHDEAIAALEALETTGHGAYPVLARLRMATVLAQKGDPTAAVAVFDTVVSDRNVPDAVRDMARLRAGLLLVDHGDYAGVSQRLEVLAVDTNTLRHSAREALGLAAWKEARLVDALAFFEQITADAAAPRNMRDRATMMAELIRGSAATTPDT